MGLTLRKNILFATIPARSELYGHGSRHESRRGRGHKIREFQYNNFKLSFGLSESDMVHMIWGSYDMGSYIIGSISYGPYHMDMSGYLVHGHLS